MKKTFLASASIAVGFFVSLSTASSTALAQPAISVGASETQTPVRLGGVLEILAPAPLQNGQPDSDRTRVRSFELTGQTDFETALRTLSAKMTFGGFDDTGTFEIGLREAFLQGSFSQFNVRVGKYFLPIGLYNQTRRSAWVTPSAPNVISRFFGDDGVVDTGLDVQWVPSARYRVRAGVMNGYTFDAGETTSGLKPETPTHYLRPTTDFGVSETREMTVALNYVGRIDDTGESNRITSLDFTLLPKLAARSWFVLGEFLYRETSPADLPSSRELGGTIYFEKPVKDLWAAGLRLDAFTIRSLTDSNGAKRSNLDWAVVPVVSFEASKEIKLQAAYTFFRETRSGDSSRTEQGIEFRLISELGSISKIRGLPGDRSSL